MRRFLVLGVLALLGPLLLYSPAAPATESADKGVTIAYEADRRDAGFGDFAATVSMTLRNKAQSESRREMSIKVLEGGSGDDGDKSLIRFSKPGDIEGTTLLTHSRKIGNDDQWIFLPAVKRVKRISSTNRSGAFAGSEFAYEDLVNQEPDKYTYAWIRDEDLNDGPAFVVERVPVYDGSGYTRQVVWYDKAEYRIQRIEYYDRKNELLKTLNISGYEKYLGQHWRAREMVMVNHQTGKSTTLVWQDYKFATGLSEVDFNKNKLRNAR
ncbi:MAG: outer membrane lipoprotein-sorting protein [Proteobacteria bacterium]|nr:outer membrane lipoprotein-sorting protein [Pseudomonadota bacterium]